jgi:Protein of unknown function (DUF3592)
MRSRGETPQETLERLNALSESNATTSQPPASPTPAERPRRSSRLHDRFPKLGLTVTVVFALAALAFGSMGLADAVQMSRFGQVATAEVLDVDHHSRGANEVHVQYPVDGVMYRGSVKELWTAPQPGESVEIVYDTRQPTHITDSPLAWDYGMSLLALVFGGLALASAVREVRRRSGSQWSRGLQWRRGSQWLPS